MTTLLEHNPGKDVVFMSHTGFEGMANLHELLSGHGTNQTVRIHMWRVANADIPQDFYHGLLIYKIDILAKNSFYCLYK